VGPDSDERPVHSLTRSTGLSLQIGLNHKMKQVFPTTSQDFLDLVLSLPNSSDRICTKENH
jgi:hypothetical protein